jgi:hypothetical protein
MIHHRRVTALLLVALLFSVVALPSSATADSGVRVAAPITVITADGNAGLRLRIPSGEWGLRSTDLHLRVEGGNYAFAVMSEGSSSRCANPMMSMCVAYDVHRIESMNVTAGGATTARPLAAITYDVYIVTDGRATLTLRFQDTDSTDAVSMVAEDEIAATFERLPRRCPTPSCDAMAYGGVTHQVSAPAYVSAISVARQQGRVGARSATACVRPGGWPNDTRSSDPADYPYGCEAPEGETQQFLLFLATSPVNLGGYTYTIHNNPSPHGPVYAGFQAASVDPTGGDFDAYGVWVDGFVATG